MILDYSLWTMGANMLTLIIQSSPTASLYYTNNTNFRARSIGLPSDALPCAHSGFLRRQTSVSFKETPPSCSCYIGVVENSRSTVHRHLSLSMESADRASYLSDAIIKGHYRQVKFYLDAGYNQDYIDNHREGVTPLILAVTHVKDDAIRNRMIVLLLQAEANPNLGDWYGLTPLMHSIILRQNSSVRLLLESKRLEYGTEDLEGNTALIHAASLGLTDIVLMILERLSPVHRIILLGRKNLQGLTACDLAGQLENKELAELLSWKNSYFFPINTAGFADLPHQLENLDLTSTRHEELEDRKSDSQTINRDYRAKIIGNL